jgi:hypothetical protein
MTREKNNQEGILDKEDQKRRERRTKARERKSIVVPPV